MVDTGWQSHPYFTSRGYNVQPTVLGPGATFANRDENGHGTAESANIFAAAPDVVFKMVKMGGDAVGAFNMAASSVPRPHIISCSWGYSIQNGPLSPYLNTLAAAVSSAVASGITVIFSAGNGHFGFPGQHPDVISAGGVFMKQNGSLQASDYSSGFQSSIYQGRKVPDVCGLVGMRPKAAYIMLPLPEGCDIDTALAGGTHPNGDETTGSDGWAAISGTSAAAPQLAGVCALIKKKNMALTPKEIKKILMKSAIDVVNGNCFPQPGMNHPAQAGHDLATGAGLVNAFKAVSIA
jgi:subtilisin family serine protease